MQAIAGFLEMQAQGSGNRVVVLDKQQLFIHEMSGVTQ